MRALAFALDGRTLAAGGKREVQLWDLAQRKERARLTGHTGIVLGLAFAPDRWTLAVSLSDGRVFLWDALAGKRKAVLAGHEGAVHALAFNREGDLLASAGVDEAVKLWDAATGREVARLPHGGAVEALAFCSDGSLLTASDDGALSCWDIKARKTRWTRTKLGQGVWRLALDRHGKFLATANLDRGGALWELRPADGIKHLAPLEMNRERELVRALAIDPDGHFAATAGSEGVVNVWLIQTLR